MKHISLYIHIPFCTSKCKYCKFTSFVALKSFQIEKYVDFLCGEIDSLFSQGKGERVDTIYFGGGTPGILKLSQIERILNTLKEKFIFADDIEITIEVNPENITKENLIGWKKLGISRISIGVQTLNKKSLKEIGRVGKGDILKALDIIKKLKGLSNLIDSDICQNDKGLRHPEPDSGESNTPLHKGGEDKGLRHPELDLGESNTPLHEGEKNEGLRHPELDSGSLDEFLHFYDSYIRQNGINISLDFIIGLPYVKKGEIKKDIEKILSKYSFISHISVYMLEIGKYPNNWKGISISEEDYLGEYIEIKNYLEQKGFFRYEISNFAKILPQPLFKPHSNPSPFEQPSPQPSPFGGEGEDQTCPPQMRGMTRNESRGAVCIFPINERGAVTISPLDKGGLRRVCKHNKGYWTHKNYLGFGVGAHSFVDNMRFSNSEKLNEYYAFLGKKSEKLTKNELFLEKLMFGLRTSGVNSSILKNLNQTKIREFIENGYLKRDGKSLILSDKGILILDYILGEII